MSETNEKLEDLLKDNKNLFLTIVAVLVIAAVGICVFVGMKESKIKKGLSAVDSIEFDFSVKSDALTDDEVNARVAKLLEAVKPYLSEKGIVGVRANMLAAEACSIKKDYASAYKYYREAASLGKEFYTKPYCEFNAAVSAEEMGNADDALNLYKSAFETPDFLLAPHAGFSYARLLDSKGDMKAAQEAYQKVIDLYPQDSWADLSQSRLIDLGSKGAIE